MHKASLSNLFAVCERWLAVLGVDQKSFESPGPVSSMPAVLQCLILRNHSRLGDTGNCEPTLGWQDTSWAGEMPSGLVTHCHVGSWHQRDCPSEDVQFRAHQCPLLLPLSEAHCPGGHLASFESSNSTDNG